MFHSAHPYLQFLRLWLTVLALLVAWPAHAVSTFTDNNDGTVSDSATSLMWDKCSSGQSGNTDCTGSGSTSLYGAGTYTWKQALVLAVTANTANYKGHNDWRLPNRLELESLVNIVAQNPAIDPAFPHTQSNYYWSSTIYNPTPTLAWGVHFAGGISGASVQSNVYHVRLVRSGQSFDSFDTLAPTVTAISPTSGSSAGGNAVTISGSLFTGATAVTIGGVAVTGLSVGNDTTITATTPAGTAGAKDVVVTAPDGAGTGVGLFTYVVPTYTVSFDNNGGSTVTSQSVAYNTATTTPSAPTKTGSTFAGWYSDSGLTASFAFTTAIVADTTLYAKWTITAIAAGLNDTGVTQCLNTAGTALETCSAANTGNAAAYPRQDARFGRDAAQAAGQLLPAKIGGGAAGFDFTPLDAAGNAIALTGTPPVPSATPACTHDNVTNLTWEVKTAANNSSLYTFAEAATYASTTNTAGLCGTGTGNPWRVPTRRELLSIVHNGTNGPAIDLNYFPIIPVGWVWTSDICAPVPANAWIVRFNFGNSDHVPQSSRVPVRLVRSGQ